MVARPRISKPLVALDHRNRHIYKDGTDLNNVTLRELSFLA
jgi:hypothetical protein